MNLGEFTFLSVLIFSLILFFLYNFNNNLQSLIISELVWITLFVFAIYLSFTLNNVLILSLTLFFLVFSAIEISVGLVLINSQKLIFKSLSTYQNTNKTNFNVNRFIRSNYVKKYNI